MFEETYFVVAIPFLHKTDKGNNANEADEATKTDETNKVDEIRRRNK